ncbi:UNVERIFIED_CONTAM: hypothetical protein Sradi_1556600 [Sesamum radiatum]|uniref:Uncharacterized protein n=1 Tax=Sesamum radiatum TaxID=300843 RepID=A0AAW2U9J3_SESRA
MAEGENGITPPDRSHNPDTHGRGGQRGTGPYQKHEMDKGKEVKDPSPASPVKGVPRTFMMGRTQVNDPPRKGIIRRITGGSKMKEDVREKVISYLRKNKYIFTWTPQDLEGIDPGVITHHLNLDPTIRPIK